jgi:sRNA-binding protein
LNALSGRKITIADLGGGHAKPRPPPQQPKPPSERDAKWAAVNQLIADLIELYPKVFDAHRPKPLAIGIREAILSDLGCDPRVLFLALGYWCRQARYRAALCANDHRFGLDGMRRGDRRAANAHPREAEAPRPRAIHAGRDARDQSPARVTCARGSMGSVGSMGGLTDGPFGKK